MSFPLYNTLLKKVKSNLFDLSKDEKKFLITNIKELSTIEHEIIYGLIRSYQIDFDSSTAYIIPYSGRNLKKGIKFDLDKFPHTLKHILLQFVITHLESV